jgi:hypothetical protein
LDASFIQGEDKSIPRVHAEIAFDQAQDSKGDHGRPTFAIHIALPSDGAQVSPIRLAKIV